MAELKDAAQRQGGDAGKAWRNWLLIFAPLFVVTMVGTKWFGFAIMIPLATALLLGVLIYQRYVKKRSWAAILWGRSAASVPHP